MIIGFLYRSLDVQRTRECLTIDRRHFGSDTNRLKVLIIGNKTSIAFYF